MSGQLEIKLLDPNPSPTGSDFCRLCLDGQPGLISLKCNIGEVSVPKMFAFLTGLEIDFEDDYPKVACSTCFTRLEQAYQTRKDFLDNFQTLMSMTVIIDSKDPIVEEEIIENEEKAIVVKEEILSEMSEVELVDELEFAEVLEEKPRPKANVAGKGAKRGRKKKTVKHEDPQTDKENSDGEGELEPEAEEALPVKKKRKSRRKFTKEELIARRKFNTMNPNKCYICQDEFEDVRSLNVHLPQHSDMLPYTCELCVNGNGPQKEKISSLVLLHRHVRMHSGHVPCPKCPYKLFGINRMYNHVKHVHSDDGKQFICEQCGKKLPNRNSFLSHKMRHKYVEEGRYTCEECGAKFGNRSRLDRHMLGHKKEKEFACQYCDKLYPSKTLLLAHERLHGGKPIFACVTCGEQFPTREKRNIHIKEVHPEVAKTNRENDQLHYGLRTVSGPPRKNKPEDYPCDYEGCDFVARTYGSLHYHKEKHRLRFMCKLCPRRFPTSQFLNNHMVVHTGEKAFFCDQCDKSYTQQTCLKRHQVVHMKDAPKSYVCSICGDAFITKTRLDNHVLKHSEPQHHCDFCERSFRYKGDWTRHMKQHTEGKLVGMVAKIEEIC